jgi:selenocysteine lyase/cysteine desulfurase
MHRRTFLRAGLSASAIPALPALAAPQEQEFKGSVFQPTEWASVRAQFPLTHSLIHLASFMLASHPRPVAEAIARHRKALDENPIGYLHAGRGDADDRQRAAAAEYMGVDPAHVALTDSTTMGLGLVYGTIDLAPGQDVVTTVHDHYSTQMALRHRAERTGAAVREIALYDEPARASAEEIVGRIGGAVGPRTRVVAVTWVHSSTGVKLPVAAIAERLRGINASRAPGDRALLCVDGVHGFGVEDVTMEALGADVFVAGTHKWIFGPRGTGVVWATPDAWSALRPVIPSFGPNYGVWLGGLTPDQVPPGDLHTPGGFHSFEHRWALEEAFRFHLGIGKARVQERIHALNTMAKDGLAEMKHVTLRTPRSTALSSGIICFDVAGFEADEVVERLRARRIVASSSPYRVSHARIAPSLVNDEDEIERVLGEIRALGG